MPLDYQTIFRELNKEKINYLVAGGLAVNFHGIPRMTYDIDLIISLATDNISRILSKLKTWGYLPRAPVDPEQLMDEGIRNAWIKDKGMKAFTLYNDNEAIGEIDLIIDCPIPFDQLKARSINIPIKGLNIPVICLKDLIEIKSQAGRKQDLADAEHLKKLLDQ